MSPESLGYPTSQLEPGWSKLDFCPCGHWSQPKIVQYMRVFGERRSEPKSCTSMQSLELESTVDEAETSGHRWASLYMLD